MTPEDSYSKLLSLAVHEFRTPASVVGGYLRMLRRDADPPLNERQRKMVEEAEKSCARIVDLVAELSEIGRLDAGPVAIAQQPLDLFALVQEVAEGMHEAADRGVRLEVRGAPAKTIIMGDAVRLRSAFHAIFRAILREMPDSTTVIAERRVINDAGKSSAVVIVADAVGVQTAYDAPRRMFDDKRGGLGLVLPLARRLIEAHAGELWSPGSTNDVETPATRGVALIAFPLSESNR